MAEVEGFEDFGIGNLSGREVVGVATPLVGRFGAEKNGARTKEFCNRGRGLSAAIYLGTPEPGFFHFGSRLT